MIATLGLGMMLTSQLAHIQPPISRVRHAPVQESRLVHLEREGTESAFHSLLRMAIRERIPMGIVVGRESALCTRPLASAGVETTLGNLEINLWNYVPGYEAKLRDGVLEISPVALEGDVSRLLDMRISGFREDAGIHTVQAANLWFWVRAIIDPGMGSAMDVLAPTSAERVPAIGPRDGTLRELLDGIADGGSGAVWVLYSSQATKITPEMIEPYEMYGYAGEEDLILRMPCMPVTAR